VSGHSHAIVYIARPARIELEATATITAGRMSNPQNALRYANGRGTRGSRAISPAVKTFHSSTSAETRKKTALTTTSLGPPRRADDGGDGARAPSTN
jgi:hypothetical protein